MPTGYTADIATGKISDFPTFVLQCARAFGALVSMRDEPMGAEIPVFEPSDYHYKAMKNAEAKLERLLSMKPDEIQSARDQEEAERQTRDDEIEARRAAQEHRYRVMLVQVERWVPPTEDHHKLKRFMQEQLAESIKFDCQPWHSEPLPAADDWFREEVEKAEKAASYHLLEHKKEVVRVRNSNQWVSDLRASLPETSAPRDPA